MAKSGWKPPSPEKQKLGKSQGNFHEFSLRRERKKMSAEKTGPRWGVGVS